MDTVPIDDLEGFIVRAKAATYAGDGAHVPPYRQGSQDLLFVDGDFSYHDSYVGGTDFAGQEVVYWRAVPVWSESYAGRIIDDAAIEAATAGRVIKGSLSAMYREGRFLGGFEHVHEGWVYRDASDGDVRWFEGRESIVRDGREVYELRYHGGLLRP